MIRNISYIISNILIGFCRGAFILVPLLVYQNYDLWINGQINSVNYQSQIETAETSALIKANRLERDVQDREFQCMLSSLRELENRITKDDK